MEDETRTAAAPRAVIDAMSAPVAVIVHAADPSLVGRRLSLDAPVTIGRRTGDLVTADPLLSRRHARLSWDPVVGAVVVEDLGSKNGTVVDGVPTERAPVSAGGWVSLGSLVLVVREADPPAAPPMDGLIGDSPPMRGLRAAIARVARSDLPVLVTGETGVGKERVAAAVHAASGRTGALVPVNCAAIPETLAASTLFGHRRGAFTGASRDAPGAFGAAERGTLLLDELGELPLPLQATLLRAIETGEVVRVGDGQPRRVDVRIVCATNVDLEAAVAAGRFRADLYERVAVARLPVAPLRQRREDILPLARAFLADAGARPRWTAALAAQLVGHDWPRNVRELVNACRRLALTGVVDRPFDVGDLPELGGDVSRPGASATPTPTPRVIPRGGPSRSQLEAWLVEHGDNVTRLAATLGRDRKTVYRWLRAHGLR